MILGSGEATRLKIIGSEIWSTAMLDSNETHRPCSASSTEANFLKRGRTKKSRERESYNSSRRKESISWKEE